MYNLLKYSSNYSDKTSSLWVHSIDKTTNFNVEIENNSNNFKYFKYKAKLLGKTFVDDNNESLKNETIAVPLKDLSKLWRSLEMSFINCKVELKIKWTKHCVLAMDNSDNTNYNRDNVLFTIVFYLLFIIVSLSAKDNQKLSKFFSK